MTYDDWWNIKCDRKFIFKIMPIKIHNILFFISGFQLGHQLIVGLLKFFETFKLSLTLNFIIIIYPSFSICVINHYKNYMITSLESCMN